MLQKHTNHWFLQALTLLAWAATLLLTGVTLLGSFAANWWVGELLGHPRPYYILGLGCCAIWLGIRHRWWGIIPLLPLLFNLVLILPLILSSYELRPIAVRPLSPLTILHYNLDITAAEHDTPFQYIRQHPADILFLQELTPELNGRLATELPDYKIIYTRPLSNTHGSVLLLPRATQLRVISAGEVHLPSYSVRPMLTATLELEQRRFTLLSIQVVRPKDAYTEEIQENEYQAVAEWIQQQRKKTGYPIIVIGDCNTTPWSQRFQHFLINSGLRDSSVGFGYQPTWPAYAPAFLQIPIDHAFVSNDVLVLDRAPGPNLGGDHTPLWLRVAMR